MNTLSQGEFRTIGGEAVAYEAFRHLGFPEILAGLGLKKEQVDQAALLIIGRLLHPASERETARAYTSASGRRWRMARYR